MARSKILSDDVIEAAQRRDPGIVDENINRVGSLFGVIDHAFHRIID